MKENLNSFQKLFVKTAERLTDTEMSINVMLICHKLCRKVTNSKFGNYGNFPNVELMPTLCILKTDVKLHTEKT